MSLTIGSLFSGIGGLELGLERAGLGPVRWQVEIDPYCRAVLAKHWPDARRYEDVRSVGPELERVDVVCGGFPCQDISPAGRKAGIAGARSGLWRDFARILGDVRPRYVVVENSAELPVRGLDAVLADVAALGFDALWFPLSAADVGAPHIRERTFVVGYADGDRESVVSVDDEASGLPTLADASLERVQQRGRVARGRDSKEERDVDFWTAEPGIPSVADGVPGRMAQIAAYGNAVVPQVAEVVGWVVRGIAERLTKATAP